MVIGGIVVIVIILLGAAYFTGKKGTKSASGITSPEAQPTAVMTKVTTSPSVSPSAAMTDNETKSFEVDGSNFKFVPNTLTVKEGETVKITFKNTQGFHNFKIDEFNVTSKTIPADSSEILTFVANKKGVFQYYCGVGNHRAMGMVGTLTVQ